MLSNRDKQLKQERGYRGKSYVRPDGSEVLLDKLDWDLRKRELYKRAGGKCEYIADIKVGINTVKSRCQVQGAIPAHIEPRHPYRDDRLSNLLLLCKQHDKIMEKQNWRKTRFGEGSKPIVKRREQ